MKSVAVFCGSNPGNDPAFVESARSLGRALAVTRIKIIYGGAQSGIMGAVADGALEVGGQVTGVIPEFLKTKELAHENLSELVVVNSMHERKNKMFELSEGFIALPGGFGTLEEVSEILTWGQLGLHQFPIGFLNLNGFYKHLELFFDEARSKDLLKPEYRSMALFCDNIDGLLQAMKEYKGNKQNSTHNTPHSIEKYT